MQILPAPRYRYAFTLLPLLCAAPFSHAGKFELGERIQGNWNLQASAGTAMRLQNADRDLLFVGDVPGGTRRSAVADDGNLNYGSGDLVSSVVKSVGDLSLTQDNYTLFLRGYAWYDYTMDNKRVSHGHYPNGYRSDGRLDDSHFDRQARFKGVDLLDVWVAGRYSVNERPLEVKFGRQSILWGRSLFARGSISSLNAINLPALHRPGAVPQEYLLPSTMLHLDYKPSDDLQLRAFYQLEWRKTVLDGCGTFYSNLDNAALGCDGTFLSSFIVPNQEAYERVLYLKRDNDRTPSNGGQFGFKVDYHLRSIDTKVGAYFINYHARLPIYSVRHAQSGNGAPFIPGDPNGKNVRFHYDYPEDIRIFGLTASKTFGAVNLAANISYVSDFPLQINTSDLTSATMGGRTPASEYASRFGVGQRVPGYRLVDLQRAELTVTKVYPGLLGSSQTTVSAEVAAETISGMPSTLRFRRHTNFGVGNASEDGYTTDFSWGYSVAVRSTYEGVLGGLTVSPALTLRQGIKGWSSDDAFQEDQRALGLNLSVSRGRFRTALNYSYYNNTRYSVLRDRDLLTLSTSVTF